MSGIEGAHNAPEIKTAAPESAEIAEQKANPDVLAAAGKNAVSGGMGALDKLANANKPKASTEHTPDQAEQKEKTEIPSPAQVLNVIIGLHKAMMKKLHENAKDKTPGIQQAYNSLDFVNLRDTVARCLNSFRAGIGLPPMGDVDQQIRIEINSALQSENSTLLLRIFNKELREAAKPKQPWYKRIPGLNFVAGTGAGAVELGMGVASILNEGRKAIGVGASEEEKHQAQEILASVGSSLKDFSHVAAAMLRSEEYADSIQKDAGETTGYVMGKTYFDVALTLLGGHALKAAKLAKHGGKAAHVATEATMAARTTHVVKHVAKEGASELRKEAAKMTGHEVEHRDHIATAEGHEENPEKEHG